MQTYRDLFGNAEFRTLFASQALVMAAASASSLALGTITYASTGSPVLTALSMYGGPLVRLVASWFLMSASDLLRPRLALVVVGAVMCLADLLQALPGMPWQARFVLLALPWVAMSATGGAKMALVSDILPAEAFVLGRSTMNIAVGVMQIAGYGVGGLLLLRLTTGDLFLCAAAASGLATVVVRFGLRDHPPRATGGRVAARSRAVTRRLLGSPLLRPVYLTLWVPNGLVVGCEALFVPFAGRHAGYLLSATTGGMLLGDIVVGRFVPSRVRDRLVVPLRLLLAAPYLLFALSPSVPVAALLGLVASFGFSASLPLQERLVTHSEADIRGQVLGLHGMGLMVMQGVGALAGAAIAALWTETAAIPVMAAGSLLVTTLLVPGLRRTRLSAAGLPAPATTAQP